MINQEKILLSAGRILRKALINELKTQGHRLTGALANSIQFQVRRDFNNRYTLLGYMLGYGQFVNDGVSASRIPFNPGSGARHSRFIDSLKTYWENRGLNPKDAERAAFATARKMKQYGMPSPGSYRYSKNGARRLFISRAVQIALPEMTATVIASYQAEILKLYNKTKSELV